MKNYLKQLKKYAEIIDTYPEIIVNDFNEIQETLKQGHAEKLCKIEILENKIKIFWINKKRIEDMQDLEKIFGGDKMKGSKLTEEKILEIQEYRKQNPNCSIKSIAEKFEISQGTVHKYLRQFSPEKSNEKECEIKFTPSMFNAEDYLKVVKNNQELIKEVEILTQQKNHFLLLCNSLESKNKNLEKEIDVLKNQNNDCRYKNMGFLRRLKFLIIGR